MAVSTAWSGYQAALWDGQQYLLYGKASKLRIDAQGIDVRGNQVRFYDASTIAEWLKAEAHGDTKLAELFERRLMPRCVRPSRFGNGLTRFTIQALPLVPCLRRKYHNVAAEQSAKTEPTGRRNLRTRDGRSPAGIPICSTVLLLAAISQRFKTAEIRAGLMILALLILLSQLWRVLALPRL